METNEEEKRQREASFGSRQKSEKTVKPKAKKVCNNNKI